MQLSAQTDHESYSQESLAVRLGSSESATVDGLSRVRPSSESPRAPHADSARLVLVPSEGTRTELLYERLAPVVNRMVWLYLATDSERDDIAQDIFISIIKSAHSVRDPALLEAWAARVAFNTICNLFRRRKLRRWLSLEALESYEPPGDHADFEGRELVTRAQRVLEQLPVAERMPFTLELFGNASHNEIARVCACSARTLRRRLKAARERFLSLARRDPALASWLTGRAVREEEGPPDG